MTAAAPPATADLGFTLPCAGCGACVPFTLGSSSALALVCPRCGANIHLQDRATSVRRAMLTSRLAAPTLRRRLRRLTQT